MTDKQPNPVCVICIVLSVAAPWVLLASAAGISLMVEFFPTTDPRQYWSSTAAYLAAAGVLWMGLSYLIAHIANTRAR